jgi:hypothetical protein
MRWSRGRPTSKMCSAQAWRAEFANPLEPPAASRPTERSSSPASAQKRPIAEATGQATLQPPLFGDVLPMR